MRTRSRTALMLGAATLVLMGGGGVLLIQLVQHRELSQVLVVSGPPLLHLALGAVVGMFMAWTAWRVIAHRRLDTVRAHYASQIGPLVQRRDVRWWLAMCAGVGEELLFRGALQHWLGIPVTAVVFVAMHGYLDLRDRPLFVYGVLLTTFMLGFGVMASELGLLAPMLAHAVFDAVLFRKLAEEHAGPGASGLP